MVTNVVNRLKKRTISSNKYKNVVYVVMRRGILFGATIEKVYRDYYKAVSLRDYLNKSQPYIVTVIEEHILY